MRHKDKLVRERGRLITRKRKVYACAQAERLAQEAVRDPSAVWKWKSAQQMGGDRVRDRPSADAFSNFWASLFEGEGLPDLPLPSSPPPLPRSPFFSISLSVGLRPMREILSVRVGRYLRSLSLARLALPQALWAYHRRASGSAKRLGQPVSSALLEGEPDEVDFRTSDSRLRRGARSREVNEWLGDWANPVSVTERRRGRQGR
uniref:Uncharacterized protein n=1 Tax=Chromera velia CCMP2878 TaxID=1169474 RepID=A0A0G4FQ41_9ALVE|eukprot:Cvel_18125.t1-p1 / transcript=Cvel_18125.t1 / gene=Cvel_18125 / organism=Chromera_velia_CCMP2878 / gene_product=hypothetical protein / transcript_product=hypothetical protein / location=Cvel_scaffold1487:10218-12053(-) / protein_length=203 / sequence_SO=supercontig / SO=protein_coding / is_pseudo=false